MEEIPTVSEIIGISDHLGGFLLRRGSPGEKAWFVPRSTPTVGSLTRFVPQPQTPPGLTTSPQASLPARPAVGLSTSKSLSDGSGDIEPPRRRVILPCTPSRARLDAPSGQCPPISFSPHDGDLRLPGAKRPVLARL